MRVALIGLGKMGLLHASILNTLPAVQLVALCDTSNLIRKVCQKIFPKDILVFKDFESLQKLDLDAVFVTTPISSHFPVIKTLYLKGIARHIFVEKSFASNYGEAHELCGLARDAGGKNMVGYMKRFSVTYLKAKELLDQEVLGALVSFEAYAYSSDFYGLPSASTASPSRGGVLKDLGAHVIDLATWYFGELRVDAVTLDSPKGLGFEDAAQLVVRTPTNLEGRFDVSWSRPEYRMPEFGLVIQGTAGSLRVTDDDVTLTPRDGTSRKWYRPELNDNVPFLLGAQEYYREDAYFAQSILAGSEAEPNFVSASKIEYTLDQITKR